MTEWQGDRVKMKERGNRFTRFLLPVGVVVVLWLAADLLLELITRQPFPFANSAAYRPVMNILSRGRILSLLLGGLLIYPILFFRGATLRERIVGSLMLPLIYSLTAIVRAAAFFPLGEALYYGLNPITMGSFFLQIAFIGLTDLLCRWWLRRQDGRPFGYRPQIASLLLGALAAFLILVWNGGENWFYLYQQGYRLLFQ